VKIQPQWVVTPGKQTNKLSMSLVKKKGKHMNTLEKHHVYSANRADKQFNDIVLVQALDIELKKSSRHFRRWS
jgi:hypothetical protein